MEDTKAMTRIYRSRGRLGLMMTKRQQQENGERRRDVVLHKFIKTEKDAKRPVHILINERSVRPPRGRAECPKTMYEIKMLCPMCLM